MNFQRRHLKLTPTHTLTSSERALAQHRPLTQLALCRLFSECSLDLQWPPKSLHIAYVPICFPTLETLCLCSCLFSYFGNGKHIHNWFDEKKKRTTKVHSLVNHVCHLTID